MILRRILAAVALLCAFAMPSYAQTGSPKTAAQLNAEINSLYPDQNQGQITPFDIRQVSLDQVASGIIGTITLSGPVSGSGTNSIITTLGIGAVDTTNLNADVFSTARSWSGLQTFAGGVTGLPAPVNPTDAATKQYVDGVSSGIVNVGASLLATAAVLPNTPTYSNGSSGIGATLTASSNTTLTVDGTAAPLNTVVLVKNQSSAFQNGIYVVTTAGSGSAAWVLTRATYFDIASQMKAGSYTFVTGGSANLNSGWTLAANVTTVGTDPLGWNQFSSSGNGVQSVGSGLYTGAVTNTQVTSSCNLFTSSLSGCVPSTSGATAISVLQSSGSWSVPAAYVASSRAAVAALNLTGVSVVQTQGYTAPGDGGGATFKNVGTSAFTDTFLLTGSITSSGSGGTSGTYTNVNFSGGTGNGCFVNATVSAGHVTSITLISNGTGCGNAYSVGDVLTISSAAIGGTTGFQYTVSTISSPLGSFIDASGNHFQYVVDQGNYINIKQFGAVMNWLGSDGSATNDFNSIQAALSYAEAQSGPSATSGGLQGSTVLVPKGTSLVCPSTSTLQINDSTILMGLGEFVSGLKLCDSGFSSGNHFITLCNPTTQIACFSAKIANIGLFGGAASSNSAIAMIFSNNDQQSDIIDRVAIYPGVRSCLVLSNGYGGAAYVGIKNLFCTPSPSSVNTGVSVAYGTTLAIFRDLIIESGGSGANIFGFSTSGGKIEIDGFHAEGISNPISIALSTSGHSFSLKNATGGSGCTNLITLQSSNIPGNSTFETITPNGCSVTILDGQPGGGNITGNIVLQRIVSP